MEEVFKTEHTSISQCDQRETFILQSPLTGRFEFKLCDLVLLRKKMNEIDMAALFDVDNPDTTLIHLPHCDKLLALSIPQVLEFRKLLNGTFDILALNSQLHRVLRQQALLD